MERANSRLFNDIEYYKANAGGSAANEKLRAENDRLRELFKRSEVNWLKEKQALLNELEITRDERQEEYRTMRPDRDLTDKEAKVHPSHQMLSTHGSGLTRGSPSMPKLLDGSYTKSKKF